VTNPPVLELDNVNKTYPGTPPVRSLREASLAVQAGELVGIVGPSGSGKSTLLHLACGLDRPTSGQVRIEGAELSRLDDAALSGLRAHRIGVVFQQFFLIEQLSALDNVAAGLLYRGIAASARRAAAMKALEHVGLAHRRHHRAFALSGGERQRVAIARAVVGRPAFILADEPTGNLDSTSGGEVLALLRELHQEGTTIIVITHDPGIAASMDRRIELRDGLVVVDEAQQPSVSDVSALPAAGAR
jgi:putative ABC transport system ATP-binding protein